MIAGRALCAFHCGIRFLLALYRQLGLVELAASLAAGVEAYSQISAIVDVRQDVSQPIRGRFVSALGWAAAIIAYFLMMPAWCGCGG